jgi:hypothetical protein
VIDDVAAKTTEQVASDLSKVVEENRRQKWQFSDGMNEARGQVAQECSERGLDYPSFDQVWEICAPRMVQAWASRAGLLGECKRAEIEGLLMRHTISCRHRCNLGSLVYERVSNSWTRARIRTQRLARHTACP